MKVLGYIVLAVVAVILIGGGGFLTLSSGLKSDPSIGLSPNIHQFKTVNVREFTRAPLGAEVKVYLPMQPRDAVSIVYDFDEYPKWVAPAPKEVLVDNSNRPDGTFGAGSHISYSAGETDVIEFLDPTVAMIAKPLWGLDDFKNHRGVVIVSEFQDGSIMHMRRYFETKSFKGWFMSKMMPMFMKNSAENLAKLHNGKVL